MDTLSLVIRSTEAGAQVSVFSGKERQTITPKGFNRSGIKIDNPGQVIDLEVDGSQHKAAYTALIALLRYALPLKKQFECIQVFTNSPLLANQLTGAFKVKDAELKALHQVAVQLKGDIVVMALPPERILKAVAVEGV